MEHFHRAASDAVGLTEKQSAGLLVDNARLNVRKAGELSRQRQTSRSAANDEDVDFRRKRCGCARGRISLRRVKDFRVAGLESVEVKLHEICFLSRPKDRAIQISSALGLCFGTAEEDRVYRLPWLDNSRRNWTLARQVLLNVSALSGRAFWRVVK
jgi:hypothetical protein